MESNGFMNMEGCVVRDESGVALAILHEVDGFVIVKKTTACTIGMYLYIVSFLMDFGFDVK